MVPIYRPKGISHAQETAMIDEERISAQSSDVADESQAGEKIVDELLDLISGAVPPTVFGKASWGRSF